MNLIRLMRIMQRQQRRHALRKKVLVSIGFICSMLAFVCGAQATPFTPKDDAQVLERLPARTDPQQNLLRQMRQQLSERPNNLALAVDLAQRYIQLGRTQGEPRYWGYAQAALQPWWQQASPPPEVQVLRATLRQSNHQFSLALQDLDAVVARDRSNAQAWLTRATVLQVQGDYTQASSSCAHLFRLAPDIVMQACLQSVASLHGDAQNSYQRLSAALQRTPNIAPDLQLWVETMLAEMAERLGDKRRAEQHFRAALASSKQAQEDSYLLAAYSDFLLQQQRPQEVVQLLAPHSRADNLLLRYALALKQSQSPLANAQIDILRQRFDAAMMRGDTVHQREQARFALYLQNDAVNALKIAEQNWQVQKEPADARILLQAALAAKQPAHAQAVLTWLQKNQLQDQELAQLAQKITR